MYNTIGGNRYHEIKKYLHFADNQRLTEGDKMSEISLLYNMLNFNLVQFGIFYEPYFGCHSAKMFITGKPILFFTKFGLRLK